jgi:deoxycytidylate deaminase
MKVLNKIEEIGYALVPSNRKDSIFFHVAVIFQRNKILSIGQNSFKTHPIAKKFGHRNYATHAELSSIIRHGLDDCSGLSLAVLRIGRNNKLTMSKPCLCCQNVIKSVGLSKVYYTNKNGEWEKL